MAAYGRHRSNGRRGPTRARRSPGSDPWMGQPDPEPPVHADDYPSWPGRPGPYALHPDHPSWPGRPDPRWADTEAALRAADDYPSWPEHTAPLRLPDRPAPPRQERPAPRPVRPAPPQPERRVPPGPGGRTPPWPDAGPPTPDRDQRFQAAPTAPVLPARGRTDLAPQPPQPVLRGRVAEVYDRPRPPAPPTRPQPAQTWQQPAPVRPEPVQVWDAGSVQLATWIISEANQHAADIRHEARDEVATSLAGAKQEATQLVRQASDQAAATLAAAELQAAEIRANVTKLTAELGGVAAYVTRSLYTPAYSPSVSAARPVISPESMPEIAPLAEPAARTATLPAAKPGTRHARKPVTRGTRSGALPKSRQLVAVRVMTVVTATLVTFALVAGTAEVALHGFSFFVFRATGTGETGPNGLQENQGPGQPDAPKLSPIHIHQAQ